MSERSFSGATAKNPMYGQGPNRTPSWTGNKKGNAPRSSTYSEAASSPPDSPSRSQAGSQYYAPQYEHPGYTVQTPGHDLGGNGGASPYAGGVPYYVQTPAPSEMQRPGGNSPFSSAPPSPPHSMGASATPFDARSTRSGRSRGSSRALNMAGPPELSEDDEEEEFFPDVERDAWRRRRQLKAVCTVLGLILLAILFVGTITAYFLLQPTAPTYSYEGCQVNQFYATNGYDSSGLPTTQLYSNLTFMFSTYNPNRFFKSMLLGGALSVGFANIPAFAYSQVPNFTTPKKSYTNFSASVSTMAFPLYGAGPLLSKSIEDRYVPLAISMNVTSAVPIAWKLIQPTYNKVLICTLNIDPYTYQFINETCATTVPSSGS